MSARFSVNLSSLRAEKGISQKQASADLGISQALLSHYEKGIRECSLAFVIRAAEYYGVTTDYILGVSPVRGGTDELFDGEPLSSDEKICAATILRSINLLAEKAEASGADKKDFFEKYYTLCIKKYLAFVTDARSNADKFCDYRLSLLCSERVPELKNYLALTEKPPYIVTIENAET